MSALITLIAAVVVFGLVIAFHEFGHFITAKWCGIQVNEFSIGMGPAIFSRIRGGTRYSIRALPIGGYVSMEGEFSDEEDPLADDVPAELKTGKPFDRVSIPRRALVMAAGAIMNFILGFLVLVVLLSGQDYLVTRQVAQITENSGAQIAGLQLGDEIYSINGRRCFVASDIVYELERASGGSADFVVVRDGKKISLPGVTLTTVTAEDGSTYLDMGFKVLATEKTVGGVLYQSVQYTAYYGRLVFRILVDLFTGNASVNDLSGPVGIVSAIGQAAAMGLTELLSLLALITINLGIMNLLPIPALDGGRLLFLLVEAVIRRPIPARFQMWVNLAGMACLLLLIAFATYNDIGRLLFSA